MRYFLAALSTAILAAIAWPANGSLTPLIFGAFVPMLWLESAVRKSDSKRKGRVVFFYAWLSFALFNLFTTWWVAYAHWSGTVATTLINGGLMAFCFWLYHLAARSIGQARALIVFPFLWMLVEYLHMDWDMSFPWLNIGYAVANRPTWIQWYSLVGTWGGTLWILWVNALIFHGWDQYSGSNRYKAWAIYAGPAILLPIFISFFMYQSYEEVGDPVNVVVVQPNIDPYTEKFNMTDDQAVDKFIRLAQPLLSDSTNYLIGPETMVGKGLKEGFLQYHQPLMRLRSIGDTMPNLHTVIGASTYRIYESKMTSTARKVRGRDEYYDAYNSSLHFTDSHEAVDIYHKTKLVVGVEQVPFMWLIGSFMEGIDLGGATGTLGGQVDREVFENRVKDSLAIATPICWEADFPGFTSEFVRNGAQVLFAITNDGWWSDTPGKDQHVHYARVRAIENRRDVARSANTGISCIINQRGDISHQIPYEETGAFAATVYANSELTVFSQTGDFLGRVSVFVAIAVLLSMFVKRRTRSRLNG
ncbi:apolipoprotein N-acyltransferase [Phaeocystidibacter luteus]|uniref:Apolipoprotein N-acyltransferase n=1 Tax=Phaeocystidibacter luteus TaxID=911197 RepID=A0A6N6RKJ0_9FLAO|nr:apolipoprotein N-acyltransferase [Phaeocystidibacter luteus]KAB2810230.1 apolipoprotein N-acyltransferase [Phaeocystidibacter luteus]